MISNANSKFATIPSRFDQCKVLLLSNDGNSGALRDLVPRTQFKKREKHPWKNVTFSKVAG